GQRERRVRRNREIAQSRYRRRAVSRSSLRGAVSASGGVGDDLIEAAGVEIQIGQVLNVVRVADAVTHERGAAPGLIRTRRVPVSRASARCAVEGMPRAELMPELVRAA